MSSRLRHALLASLLLAAGSLMAVPPPKTPFNPAPAEGDLVLPMPDGWGMVLRRVVVPGRSFWGDPRQVVQVGDGSGGIFEGLQRMQISGAFADGKGDRRAYWLGKYEVTKGQFVAVMGLQHLLEVTGDTREQAELSGLQGTALEKRLSEPLTFVPWQSMLEFIHRYNLWLFDPEHKQRLESMPRVDDSPGFIRLPTELEWEYAARDGLPALDRDSFTSSLPFPKERMERHAWFLENARHRVRPIGLREPNRLGLYDMLGNVQELCEGLFMPELWQGPPGGLVARGGSVGTPAADLRSSRREEVEMYRWMPEEQIMRPWRSYNTGMRLAIGANVVRSTENRRRLEQEYLTYRQAIRGAMPVGRTLDNPVDRASQQLNAAREQLNETLARNQTLESELSRIRQDIDKAQGLLDQAMRESARSSAQDLLRDATNLGRDHFKLESFQTQLAEVKKLTALSPRYQDLDARLQEEITKRTHGIDESFVRYLEDLQKLGELGELYVEGALDDLAGRRLTPRAATALELIGRHLAQYRALRRGDEVTWRKDFRETFKNLAD